MNRTILCPVCHIPIHEGIDTSPCRDIPCPIGANPDAWGNTDDDYRARMDRVRATVLELNAEYERQLRSGEYRAPSRFMLEPLTELRQHNADAQFDNARERDEQGKPMGEPLWP